MAVFVVMLVFVRNMWNFQVPWMGKKTFHFKISRAKVATFLVIGYKCKYAVIQIPALQNQRLLWTTNKDPTTYSYTLYAYDCKLLI